MINTKAGIFGGSFDPVTKMHLRIAYSAIELVGLHYFFFEPVNSHYTLKDVSPVENRIRMLELAIDNYGFPKESSVSCGSVDAYSPKQLYTYELLDHYQMMFPNTKIYFIMGSDNLKDLLKWKKPEYILKKYRLLIHPRGNHSVEEIIKDNKLLYTNRSNIQIIKGKRNHLSSTLVRTWLENGTSVPATYVQKQVMDYILEKKLYQS